MKRHLPFIILCLILVIYLGLKTLPVDGWSGWGIFSAQTLLTAKYWTEDGFIHHKFLFIPIGYSKIVQYFDDPAMRQHARGTTTGGLIGNRLYYTHYPSGYLIPYALLMKLGVEQRHWFRLLALFFSLAALILMYVFFNLLTGPAIAFIAIAYYAISTMFLDYADSLANQPIDDLLRFAILVLSLLALRRSSQPSPSSSVEATNGQTLAPIQARFFSRWLQNDKLLNFFIWFLYFLLSLSSYDSTLFIFIWLVGLEIVTHLSFLKGEHERISFQSFTTFLFHKNGLWRRIIFFASAPILAFAIQMLQNYWYLGNWREVWLDMMGASMAKAQTGNILLHLKDVFYTWSLASGFNILWSVILAGSLFILLNKLFPLQKVVKQKLNLPALLFVLLLSGAIYPFIFVGSGGFSYQGRQIMPFLSLLIGSLSYAVYAPARSSAKAERSSQALLIIIILLLTALWLGQIYRTIRYVYAWPNNRANEQIIELSKQINLLVPEDKAIFEMTGDLPINSVGEYYLTAPVLHFKNQADLIRDLWWLKSNSQFPFVPIIMADDKQLIEKIKNDLPDQYQNNSQQLKIESKDVLIIK